MNNMQTFTKSEYQDMHEGIVCILKSIDAKIHGTDGSYFSDEDKVELRAEYKHYAALADKIDVVAWS